MQVPVTVSEFLTISIIIVTLDAAHWAEQQSKAFWCPGFNYQFGCSQVGPAGTNDVIDQAPVFMVRNATSTTGIIYTVESAALQGSKYVVAVGPLHMLEGGRPGRTFYLIVNNITVEDGGNQFTCAPHGSISHGIGDVEGFFQTSTRISVEKDLAQLTENNFPDADTSAIFWRTGYNYHITCPRVGPAGTTDVLHIAPVFLIHGVTSTTTVAYTTDSSVLQGSKYQVAAGPLHTLEGGRPSRTFYLIVNNITEYDDGTNLTCSYDMGVTDAYRPMTVRVSEDCGAPPSSSMSPIPSSPSPSQSPSTQESTTGPEGSKTFSASDGQTSSIFTVNVDLLLAFLLIIVVAIYLHTI